MTSLNRLYMQLWPSAVFLFFMMARTPEDALIGKDVISSEKRTLKTNTESGEAIMTEAILSSGDAGLYEKQTVLQIIDKVMKLEIVRELIVVDDFSTDGREHF